MFNYKNAVLILFSISLIFSNQFENYFNGAIPSNTKIPKKGKIYLEASLGFGRLTQSFNDNGFMIDNVDEWEDER